MKVWIAEMHFDYEGFIILGVFDSKEKAQDCCDANESSGDRRLVSEHDVS